MNFTGKYLNGVEDPYKQKIYKLFHVEVKAPEEGEKRTLVVKISDPLPDRSQDRVFQEGIVADNYANNPVVSWAHKYDQHPIAKCNGLQITKEGTFATIEFPPEGKYEKADLTYWMYKNHYLNTWSVGFMPLEYVENELGGYDFKKIELFEFAAVPVPDNPRALTIMRGKGVDVED